MEDSTFRGRLKEAMGGRSPTAFAKSISIPPSTLRGYLDEGSSSSPSLENAARIADGLGVSLRWLATGEGPMAIESAGASSGSEFAFVPRLDVKAAAGAGVLAETEEVSDFLAFRSDWLRRMGISPKGARVLTNKGDSMEPTIRDGDALLIDITIDRIVDNAIYVVVYSGLVLLKRVQVKLDGSVVLSSDNTAYEPEVVKQTEVEHLQIAGRLMWFGRSI